MHKLFGVIFLTASFGAGLGTWHIWRQMDNDKTNIIFLPGLAVFSFFFLIVGVKFMLGQNPIKEMWRQSLDDDD